MMEIITTNKNDPEYERMFDGLVNEVFGFSFAPCFPKSYGTSDMRAIQ